MNEERKIEADEVDAVTPPPRARVTEDFARKRDYLAGFLSGETKPKDEAASNEDLKQSVVDALNGTPDFNTTYARLSAEASTDATGLAQQRQGHPLALQEARCTR